MTTTPQYSVDQLPPVDRLHDTEAEPSGWSAQAESVLRTRAFSWSGDSVAWIWAGIVAVAGGFLLIAVSWGQAAGETEVYRQLPYVVSAGLVGLAVIIIGLAVLTIASGHRDSIERQRQVAELRQALVDMKDVLVADRDGERR